MNKNLIRITIVSIVLIILGIMFNINSSFASTRSDITFTFEELTDDEEVSILLSEDLLKYNMKSEIDYLKENNSDDIEVSLSKLQGFYDDEEYLEYVKYMATFDSDNDETEKGNIVLASNYFLFNASKIGSYYKNGDKKYVEIRPSMSDDNTLKVELKEFLKYYTPLDLKIKIEDKAGKTHLLDLTYEVDNEAEKTCNLDDYNFVVNCSEYTFYSQEVQEDNVLNNATSLVGLAGGTNLLRNVIIVFVVIVVILVSLLVLVIKKVK